MESVPHACTRALSVSIKVERPKLYCYVSMFPLTLFTLARHPRQYATHGGAPSTAPILARHPRKHVTHTAHNRTNDMPFVTISHHISITYILFILILSKDFFFKKKIFSQCFEEQIKISPKNSAFFHNFRVFKIAKYTAKSRKCGQLSRFGISIGKVNK